MIKNKKIYYIFIFFIAYIGSFFCYAQSSDESITDREFLLLSMVSYCNTSEKNVHNMLETKIEDFSLAGLVEPEDLTDWELTNYEINDNSVKEGFSIFVFKKNNNIVIVPRGTDGGLMSENYKYLWPTSEHPQAIYMEEFVKNFIKNFEIKDETKIYFAGHSLGGYLSLYGAGVIMDIETAKDHFAKVVTFNGLGLGRNTKQKIFDNLFSLKEEQIANYRINGDVVSYLGSHITTPFSFSPVKLGMKTNDSIWYRMVPSAKCHQLSQFLFHRKFWSEKQQELNKNKDILDSPVQTPGLIDDYQVHQPPTDDLTKPIQTAPVITLETSNS